MCRCFSIIFMIACLMWHPIQQASAHEELAKDIKSQVDKYLDKIAIENGVAGYSLAILKNGELVHTRARGLSSIELGVSASEETVYQAFSLAKLFVNVTIMQLVQDGSIELDARISLYLEELPTTWRHITVRQAMSHMTGLPDYYQWPNPTPATAQDALQSVADKALEFETGSATRYNQTNYLLLRMMIERITGDQFDQIMAARMIDKLEIESTSYGGEYAIVEGRATTYRSLDGVLARNVHIDQPDYMFAGAVSLMRTGLQHRAE